DPVARRAVDEWLALVARLERESGAGGWIDADRLDEALDAMRAPPDGTPEAARVELLTMHAAKGLEWDVVLLPGLGLGRSRSERPLLAFTEVATGGDSGMLIAPAPAPDGDRALFDLVRSLEKRKDAWERMRLFYVAATRARRELHLFGHVDSERGEPEAGSLLRLVWQDGSVADAGLVTLPDDVGAREADQAIFQPGRMRETPTLRLPVGGPGAGGADRRASPFVWAGPEAAPVGDALHLGLKLAGERGAEHWRAEDAKTAEAAMQRVLLRRGLSGDMLADALARACEGVRRTMASERGRWILSSRHDDAHCEWALLERLAHGETREWIIDRAFVAPDHNGVPVRWIVDYKTAEHEGGDREAFLTSEAERHRVQLANYARRCGRWSRTGPCVWRSISR
ncbi:MAG: 3'-5' exonuclease, partial [Mariprofundaceae bacterium]